MLVGTAVLAVLTACGGGSATGSADGGPKEPVVFGPDMIRTALMSEAGAPEGWTGSGPRIDLDNGLTDCEQDTHSACGGFVARGLSHLRPDKAPEYESRTPGVRFLMLSFRSTDDAKAAMKSLMAEERRLAAANGVGTKPLRLSVEADETDAFTGRRTSITMRTGALLVLVQSQDLREEQPYGDLAGLQMDRIRKTAEGGNPDA
ncbi:hypothetical protein [Streptomyces sp. NPDC059134]|uniref:hypothetical protein n=1 Tax=Streptomyces sp. NPDC059134 TaxID=3346738 RepID=UPI0036BD350A